MQESVVPIGNGVGPTERTATLTISNPQPTNGGPQSSYRDLQISGPTSMTWVAGEPANGNGPKVSAFPLVVSPNAQSVEADFLNVTYGIGPGGVMLQGGSITFPASALDSLDSYNTYSVVTRPVLWEYSAGGYSAVAWATFVVAPAAPKPSSFFPSGYEYDNERVVNAPIEVDLEEQSPVPITINYELEAGATTASSADYTLPGMAVTFLPGETRQWIGMTVNGDSAAADAIYADQVVLTLRDPPVPNAIHFYDFTCTIVPDHPTPLQVGSAELEYPQFTSTQSLAPGVSADLQTGALLMTQDLTGGTQLLFNSLTSSATDIATITVTLPDANLISITDVEAFTVVDGQRVPLYSPVYYVSESGSFEEYGTGFGDELPLSGTLTFVVLGGDLPTGRHHIEVDVTSGNIPGSPIAFGTTSFDWNVVDRSNDSPLLVDEGNDALRSDSAFGANWTLAGLDRLVLGNHGALWVKSNGASLWFPANGAVAFDRPAGDFSTLATGDWEGQPAFVVTEKDGTKLYFDQLLGLLRARGDRDNNVTTYHYTDNRGIGLAEDLSSINDPYGRITRFHYTVAGTIDTITDFAERVTALEMDADEMLEGIEFPSPIAGGPSTGPLVLFSPFNETFEVQTPSDLLIAGGFDYCLGGSVQHGGRLRSAGLLGGGFQIDPYDMWRFRGMYGDDPTPDQQLGAIIDADGVKTTFRTDQFGNLTQVTDVLGNTTTYERYSNGLLKKETDPAPGGVSPLGPQVTTYQYDHNADPATTMGNLTEEDLPGGLVRKWQYDPKFNELTQYIDEYGHETD